MKYANRIPAGFFFQGQLLHFLSLVVLLTTAFLLVDFQQLRERSFLGVTAQAWFIMALAAPIVHQVYVWFVWRSELCYSAVSGKFGRRGFLVYRALFVMLLLSRPLTLIALTISDHDSFEISLLVRLVASVTLAVPAIYTLYSVARYFGVTRACGADHFDLSYRDLPRVREGIFRFNSNAMYTFAFLLLHAIAIAGASRAALVVSLLNHAYIWVHYFCTERPDMQLIYGAQTSQEQ